MSSPDAVRAQPDSRRGGGARTVLWFALTQGVSRLVSFYVFAALSHRVDAAHLGALALATAFAAGAFAVAPAIVGKPLAAAPDPETRRRFGSLSQSAAVLCSLVGGACLIPPALLTHGVLRLAFVSGVIGVPTVMIVESSYWRTVFVDGPRAAALSYSVAYGLQAVLVTAAVFVLPPGPLVVASFAALGVPAAVALVRVRDLTPSRAWEWLTRHRTLWWPYVVGVAAGVALVQAIPTVLSATAGFAAASTYRAAELAFGGTNLLIGIATQTLLTQATDNPRRVCIRVSVALSLAAGANGLLIGIVPTSVVRTFVGPTAPLLMGVLLIVTIQRAALSMSTVSAVLLVPRASAGRIGLLDVVTAVGSIGLLVLGGVLHGLSGAITGLTIAEFGFVLLFGRLLWKAT